MASCSLLPELQDACVAFDCDEIRVPRLVQGAAVFAQPPSSHATASILLLARAFEAVLAEIEKASDSA
jgi:hypothetical protein